MIGSRRTEKLKAFCVPATSRVWRSPSSVFNLIIFMHGVGFVESPSPDCSIHLENEPILNEYDQGVVDRRWNVVLS